MNIGRLAPLGLALGSLAAGQTTYYVNANLTTGTNDGSSWANALQGREGLGVASTLVNNGDTIFIAEGEYVPTQTFLPHEEIVFLVSVQVYGGFQGFESSPEERPPFGSAPTVIHGDINGDDDQGSFQDNAGRLMSSTATVLLDGIEFQGAGDVTQGFTTDTFFTSFRNCEFRDLYAVEGAAINAVWVEIRDCHFENNAATARGGAIRCTDNIGLSDCTFRANRARQGGAVYTEDLLGAVRCSFVGNSAEVGGAFYTHLLASVFHNEFLGNRARTAGVGVALGQLRFENCTAYGNESLTGDLFLIAQTGTVNNSIFWRNHAQCTGPCQTVPSTVAVTYSLVEGGHPGTGNIDADPLFVDATQGNLRLGPGSPCIDAGSGAEGSSLDLGFGPRRVDDPAVTDTGAGPWPNVDIGAFEAGLGRAIGDCPWHANSTGGRSRLTAIGSPAISTGDVDFLVYGLPNNEQGIFLMSASNAEVSVGNGTLCLGGPVVRFHGSVVNTGATGIVSLSLDMTSLPGGVTFQPGETWHFQLWHRDGASSNFSSGLSITLE